MLVRFAGGEPPLEEVTFYTRSKVSTSVLWCTWNIISSVTAGVPGGGAVAAQGTCISPCAAHYILFAATSNWGVRKAQNMIHGCWEQDREGERPKSVKKDAKCKINQSKDTGVLIGRKNGRVQAPPAAAPQASCNLRFILSRWRVNDEEHLVFW